jgi:hypothetical protein
MFLSSKAAAAGAGADKSGGDADSDLPDLILQVQFSRTPLPLLARLPSMAHTMLQKAAGAKGFTLGTPAAGGLVKALHHGTRRSGAGKSGRGLVGLVKWPGVRVAPGRAF